MSAEITELQSISEPSEPISNLGGSGPCLAGTIDELVDNQYEYVNECPNDLQLSLHH